MEKKNEIILTNFYIFNPTFGPKEGEEEKKIFFYYPSKTDINRQIKTVGLSEAIIKFTRNFTYEEECKSVHTLKTRQYFYQPEIDYWMVMTINVPQTQPKNELKDLMYYSENLNDDVYFCVLKQAYEMYKLFVGSFQSLVKNESNITNLKLKISNFFSKFLNFMKISDCDIIDVFQGIQFLPLDKKTYLHVQSFMNLFQCAFDDQIEYFALLVKNHLVWSNIETTDLRIIYQYLITDLLAPYIGDNNSEICAHNELSENKFLNEVSFIDSTNSSSRFITCSSFYSDNDNGAIVKVPKIYIRHNEKNLVYQLLVYNVLSSFICIFVPEAMELSLDFLKNIENFLKLKLVALASELTSYAGKKRFSIKSNVSSSGNPFSYIYFNKLNLAQKNTLRDNKSHHTSKVLSILADICFDKKRTSSTGETIIKTCDDFWIIGQFCNEREFYVTTQQKNTTLIEISEEMKKICDKQLKSIFFHV